MGAREPGIADQAPSILCVTYGRTYLCDAAGGATQRGGSGTATGGTGRTARDPGLPGITSPTGTGPEPQGRLAGFAGVYEKRRRHGDRRRWKRPVAVGGL